MPIGQNNPWPIVIFFATQTFPPRLGGMQAVMYALAERLAHQGDEVCVLPDHPYDGEAAFKIVHQSRPKLLRPLSKRAYLKRHLRREDTFICDSWRSVSALPRGARHVVVLAHGQEYLNPDKRRFRVERALRRASHIVASSAYTLGLIEDHWSTDHLSAAVIAPTYMLSSELPRVARGRGSSPLKLLTISRLEGRKGLLYVMHALGRLRGRLKPFHWSIAGDGPQRAELKQACERLGLVDQVSFLGPVNDQRKAQLLNVADLFIMPSYQQGSSLEGFGISYIEAAYYGLAAISGRAGGAPEAVLDGVTGWNIDPRVEAEIDHALTVAMENHDLRCEARYCGPRAISKSICWA